MLAVCLCLATCVHEHRRLISKHGHTHEACCCASSCGCSACEMVVCECRSQSETLNLTLDELSLINSDRNGHFAAGWRRWRRRKHRRSTWSRRPRRSPRPNSCRARCRLYFHCLSFMHTALIRQSNSVIRGPRLHQLCPRLHQLCAPGCTSLRSLKCILSCNMQCSQMF